MTPILPTHRPRSFRGRFMRSCSPKAIAVILTLVTSFIVLVNTARRDRWVRDVAYITRPWWDRSDETPKQVIAHYDTNEVGAHSGELCGLHGWLPSPKDAKPSRIFDAFLVSTELDLLEIRLHELIDVVDFFLILEATRSFSGDLRPTLDFAEARADPYDHRFAFAEHKIRYTLVDDLVPSPFPSPFTNEATMRNHMETLLLQSGVKEGDIVLMSDVDEIPSARTVQLLQACGEGWPSPLHLNMRNYRFSFEFPMADAGYWRPKAVRWHPGEKYTHGKASDVMLADAGWHCSWCFRYIEDMQFKMKGYSHNDRVKGDYQLLPERITKHTCGGSDIFDMFPEAYSFHNLYVESGGVQKATSFMNIPDYLILNADRFSFLLPGGCARKSRREGP